MPDNECIVICLCECGGLKTIRGLRANGMVRPSIIYERCPDCNTIMAGYGGAIEPNALVVVRERTWLSVNL